MPRNDAEYQRQYQREYRARKRAQEPGEGNPTIEVKKKEEEFANEDRRDGLPRSNYYSDYTKIIPAMSQAARDQILKRINKPAK